MYSKEEEKARIIEQMADSELVAGIVLVNDSEALGYCVGSTTVWSTGKVINGLRHMADEIQGQIERGIGVQKTAELLRDVDNSTNSVNKAKDVNITKRKRN